MTPLPPPKVRRILLIDDDRLQQRLMQGLVQNFRGGAFELEGAESYAEGLKKLLSGKYAVCLLDYRLDDKTKVFTLGKLEVALRGQAKKADALYKWFLPLLRMDTVPKFVQLIKLQQTLATGGKYGNNRVRAPRLELEGKELAEATAIIEKALATTPEI